MSGKSVVREADQQNYLLVEGKDDEHVFYSLLAYHNIPVLFKIKNKEGIDKLLDTLDVELERSGLKHLGVVVDADSDLNARWQRLRNILIKLGYELIPLEPDPEGTIIHQYGQPTVGIWLMPNNKISGMLENFVSFLVPDSNNLLWSIAGEAVQQIPEHERRFPPIHLIKARLYTWLAWQEEPGTPMGLAITKRYFDADAPHAQQLINWIRQLFELEL